MEMRKKSYTIFRKTHSSSLIFLILFLVASCKKNNADKKDVVKFTPKHIIYQVTGTNFRLNFIDSNSVFQKDQVFHNAFKYEFNKGPGASIGISIHLLAPVDTIYSWSIYMDGKLYANAFSEGGAYMTVPYN